MFYFFLIIEFKFVLEVCIINTNKRQIYRSIFTPSPRTTLYRYMRICNAKSQKRSAKGSNF